MTAADQTELVPVSVEDRVRRLRAHLERAADKAEGKVDKAEQAHAAALAELELFDETIAAVAAEAALE